MTRLTEKQGDEEQQTPESEPGPGVSAWPATWGFSAAQRRALCEHRKRSGHAGRRDNPPRCPQPLRCWPACGVLLPRPHSGTSCGRGDHTQGVSPRASPPACRAPSCSGTSQGIKEQLRHPQWVSGIGSGLPQLLSHLILVTTL